jgi:hypothetical protein
MPTDILNCERSFMAFDLHLQRFLTHYFLCCYGAAVRAPIQSNSSYLTASSTLFLLLLSACSPVHHFIFPTFLNNDPSISTADFAALPISASSVLPSANHNSCSAKKECGMVTRRKEETGLALLLIACNHGRTSG